jgi:hypothetical protein
MRILFIIFTLLLITVALKAQCKGTTKAGKPCRSAFVNKTTGYCRLHDPKAIHCAHTGCHMIVKAQGSYCRFHKN